MSSEPTRRPSGACRPIRVTTPSRETAETRPYSSAYTAPSSISTSPVTCGSVTSTCGRCRTPLAHQATSAAFSTRLTRGTPPAPPVAPAPSGRSGGRVPSQVPTPTTRAAAVAPASRPRREARAPLPAGGQRRRRRGRVHHHLVGGGAHLVVARGPVGDLPGAGRRHPAQDLSDLARVQAGHGAQHQRGPGVGGQPVQPRLQRRGAGASRAHRAGRSTDAPARHASTWRQARTSGSSAPRSQPGRSRAQAVAGDPLRLVAGAAEQHQRPHDPRPARGEEGGEVALAQPSLDHGQACSDIGP